MEWKAPSLIISVVPYGEQSLIAKVLTRQHGTWRGLIKGGSSSRQVAIWQPGNWVNVRWNARLAEQLGYFQGELLEASSAFVLVSFFRLSLISACCAFIDQAWPEHDSMPTLFDITQEMVQTITHSPFSTEYEKKNIQRSFLLWGAVFLEYLGYGLDFSHCVLTGRTEDLRWISPKSGCVVTDDAAQPWKSCLFPLPQCFIIPSAELKEGDWAKGLKILGHFFEKNIFFPANRPIPFIYRQLYEQAVLDGEGG